MLLLLLLLPKRPECPPHSGDTLQANAKAGNTTGTRTKKQKSASRGQTLCAYQHTGFVPAARATFTKYGKHGIVPCANECAVNTRGLA
eukprot:470360-Pelagomonas_calceolata.AAC.5